MRDHTTHRKSGRVEPTNRRLPFGVLILAFRAAPRVALEGLFWRCMGKRLRGWNMICHAASTHPDYYRLWVRIKECEPLGWDPAGRNAGPLCIAVIAGDGASEADIRSTLESVEQLGVWEQTERVIYVVRSGFAGTGDPKEVQAPRFLDDLKHWATANRNDGHVLALLAGDRLAAGSAGALQRARLEHADASLIYWDEDRLDVDHGRAAPWLKPQWNALHFLEQDYLTGASLLAARAIPPLSLPNQDRPIGETLALLTAAIALCEPNAEPVRLPGILLHRKVPPSADRPRKPPFLPSKDRMNAPSKCVLGALRLEGQQFPSISIIIPTRDRLDLLRNCLDGISRTTYPGKIDIIVANNDSSDPEILDFFKDFATGSHRVIDFPGPFNFSAINNHAAAAATGDLLCLLNNDVEVRDPNWLTRMARFAVCPHVGAVGARLLYPDGTIQHAGIVIGIGRAAGHMHRNEQGSTKGGQSPPETSRYVTAVTAACLVVDRQRFHEVGGFDADEFAVAFNDVDFCLKLDRAGYKNVYAAEAILIHHESKSRGDDMSATNLPRFTKELAALQRRWGTEDYEDRYFHPFLSRRAEHLVLEL